MRPLPRQVQRLTDIVLNLNRLKAHIETLETKYHREKGSVALLAVSKKQSIQSIKTLADAGHTQFGENYLQEALTKMSSLTAYPLEWHFIGLLQSNKIRKIAAHFAWVHSVSNLKLATALSEHRPENMPFLNICLQVNLNPGDGRGGMAEEEVFQVAKACLNLPRIRLRGLMCLPLLTDSLNEQRQAFHRLQTCYQQLQNQGISLDTLSAGTSHDLEAAIAEGATLVRIGTALFGPRE